VFRNFYKKKPMRIDAKILGKISSCTVQLVLKLESQFLYVIKIVKIAIKKTCIA
jgi:hypothetical protein